MASFNVQEFRAQMTGDGARPNLFHCELPFLGNLIGSAAIKYNFMCRAAQLPGSTVNQVPVNYFGRELKFAGNRTFTEWTVTIINDEDFAVRRAFEIWMSKLNSHVANLRDINYLSPAQYQQNGTVTQFSKSASRAIKIYNFIGMFPIDITPIELDWGANDTIEEYAVTFAYQWWESDSTDSAATSGAPAVGGPFQGPPVGP
jgi:hypothetical protein